MKKSTKNYAIWGALGAISVLGVAIFLVAINITPEPDPKPVVLDREIFVEGPQSNFFEATQQIKKISSETELRAFLAEAEVRSHSGRIYDEFAMADTAVRALSEPVPEPEPSGGFFVATESLEQAPRNTGSVSLDRTFESGEEFSSTNVQVENVDEPDFMKNDGKYLYILNGDKLTIIDAYPADEATIILKIGIDIERQDLQNMFLNEDRLVIFYNNEEREYTISQYSYEPDYIYKQKTHTLILDVSEKDNPTIVKDYEVDGYYHDARMIGNHVYFVSQSGIDYHRPVMPAIMESNDVIIEPDIFYFDNPEFDYRFTTITSLDIFGDSINSETFLMGDANTIYVSEDSIYVTYQKNLPYHYFDALQKDRFYDVVVPLLPKDVQQKIKSIESNPTLDWYEKWQNVSDLLLETFNSMPEDDRERLFREIERKLDEYDSKVLKSATQTVIHKIAIDGENFDYSGKGEVPGHLLNQFSMDEHDDRFRLATTSSYSGRHISFTHNNVYVLDDNLQIVGSLENIAPDETIYSARFMGDKLYLVTFQRIDPFFVIDLSQDKPRILGELKIPGFSNYLHPYDENHIIGIGKDTEETKGGGVRTLGLKMALFDVSNFNNPKTVDTIVIGNENTESEVLHNHKAFLLDVEKNILSFPVRDYNREYTIDEETGERIRNSKNWLGFYVYGVDTKGFEHKGTIEHFSGNGYDYRFNGNNRAFYIENVFYTVSSELVKMNDINEISNEINELELRDGAQLVKYLS